MDTNPDFFGFFQALYLCENPPSFEEAKQLQKRYPLVDPNYESVYKKPMPKEGYGDDSCVPRVRKTIQEILRKHKDAGHYWFSFNKIFSIFYFKNQFCWFLMDHQSVCSRGNPEQGEHHAGTRGPLSGITDSRNNFLNGLFF